MSERDLSNNPSPKAPGNGAGDGPDAEPAPAAAPPEREASAQVAAAAGAAQPVDTASEQIETLRKELDAKSKKLDEVARAYSGLLNEQKESRGRFERERARVLETERGNIALHLLDVSDELDRAMSAAADQESPLAKGVRLIREGLQRRLNAMGIERMALTGKLFDPNVAEAVDMAVVAEASQDGHVLEELSAGYRLGDRLLRPARVRVAKHVPPAAAAPEGNGAEPPATPT